MNFCRLCGTKYLPGAKFCGGCGAPRDALPPGVRAAAPARQGMSGWAIAAIVGGAGFFLIAILVAIAIPTFLGARARAQDRVAQASLRNTVTAAKAIYTDHQDYREARSVTLAPVDRTITFVEPSVDSTGPATVSAGAQSAAVFIGAARSLSGTCWWIRDSVGGPGTQWNRVRTSSSCRAALIPTSGWSIAPGSPFE